jgi:hypothetical protein
MKRQQPILLVFIGIASIFLCSCATIDSASKKLGPVETGEKLETFYVGLSGLKLFPEPRFSKTFIATLPLHEEVVRDKLEKGFAHVRVVRTGQTGWVNNSHLVWRTSPPPKPVPPEPSPLPKPVPPEPTPEKRPSEENVIQEPANPDPEMEGRDAAIFDRF